MNRLTKPNEYLLSIYNQIDSISIFFFKNFFLFILLILSLRFVKLFSINWILFPFIIFLTKLMYEVDLLQADMEWVAVCGSVCGCICALTTATALLCERVF